MNGEENGMDVGRKRKTVAIIAALHAELAPVARRLKLKRRGPDFVGRCAQLQLIATVSGIGQARARAATSRLIESAAPDLVIAMGCAGALSPDLRTGDAPPFTSVADTGGRSIPLEHNGAQTDADSVTLLTSNAPVLSNADKRSLRERTGAAAVDMEIFAIVELAAKRRIPLRVLRVIFDDAKTALPADVLDWTCGDGNVNLPGVLKSIVRRPWVLGKLVRMGRMSNVVGRVLADGAERMLTAYNQEIGGIDQP